MVYLVSGGTADGAPRRCQRVEIARMRVVRTSVVPACVRRHGVSSTDRKPAPIMSRPHAAGYSFLETGRTDERVALTSRHQAPVPCVVPHEKHDSDSVSHPRHLSPADD